MPPTLTLELPSLTSEFIRVPVSATYQGRAVDLTTADVVLAFIRGSRKPISGEWQSAAWEVDDTGPVTVYYARVIPDPTLTEAEWFVWVKVILAPEVVVRKCPGSVIIF